MSSKVNAAVGASGPTGPMGATGPAGGATGPTGAQGATGSAGGATGPTGPISNSVIFGTDAPGATGANGDVFVDKRTGRIYQKASGTWNLQVRFALGS